MPTKDEIIKGLNKKLYTATETAHLIRQIQTARVNPPSKFKKGDVIVVVDSGHKTRPSVIVKVYRDSVMSIPLSTTEDELNLVPYKSRFWGEGWFSKALVTTKKADAETYFKGVFDNNRGLNDAIKAIKELINQI